MQHMCLCNFVYYVSDESSLYTASSDAGGDSDSSYCPTSYRRRSQTVIGKGPVLGSIVIHPLVLQTLEPHTGTQWPVCNESPESVKPALWNNPAVIPNRVGFVKLSQIGVFVDSINKIRGCKTPGCVGNLVPVAVKSTGMGGGLSVWFGCDGCKVKPNMRMNLPTIMISV